jgi:AraC-type DNA-binding domain-containing proteins
MNHLIKKVVTPEEFSPYLVDCRMFISSPSIKKGSRLRQRNARYYEFELFLEKEGSIFLENKLIPLVAGDIIFRRPGQLTYGIAPHKSLLVFFNATEDYNKDKENQELYSVPILEKIPPVIHPEPTEAYQQLFYNILNEYANASYASPLLTRSHLLKLIYNLYFWTTELSGKTIQSNSPYYTRIKKVINYIQCNYALKIDLNTLAGIADLSPNYFHKVFSQIMNMTPYEYINNIRLDKAKEYLIQTDLKIQKVAENSGFENSSYFSEVFKKAYSISPRDFRKKYCM